MIISKEEIKNTKLINGDLEYLLEDNNIHLIDIQNSYNISSQYKIALWKLNKRYIGWGLYTTNNKLISLIYIDEVEETFDTLKDGRIILYGNEFRMYLNTDTLEWTWN